MGVNNFKKLELEEESRLSMDTDRVRNGITSNISAFRFITDIVELYFPRMLDLFVGLTGGQPGSISSKKSSGTNKYPDLN